MKSTLNDKEIRDKISTEYRSTIKRKIQEATKGLKATMTQHLAVRSQSVELESILNPIMQKIYANVGGAPGGIPGGFPGDDFPGSRLPRDGAPGAGSHGVFNVEKVD